jgi:transposase
MTQKRNRLSGAEKIAIVMRYLVERVPISDLCDEYWLQPSQIYRWQASVFEHGADVFDLKEGLVQHFFCKSRASEVGHLASMFR